MLDFYTLQKTLTALSNDEHKYTPTDVATLCRAGKLTPLFSYNRCIAVKAELMNGNTGEYYECFSAGTITPFNGYLTNRQLLDLLDGYSDSVTLEYAYNDKGYEVLLVAHELVTDRFINDENYDPYSNEDPLTVTREQILFKREQVDALAGQTQDLQRHRVQTDEIYTDKKLIAMMALLLAKQSNAFRIGQKPNYKQINKAILDLATDLKIDNEDMTGLKANAHKISKAVQEHADMFKLSKD